MKGWSAQGVNQSLLARAVKAVLLEETALEDKGPAARKDGAHAADPAVEQVQQCHASANGEAAQQVVLPADREEGVDEGHGIGLSSRSICCLA